MVKIAYGKSISESFDLESSPVRRSITAAKRSQKEETER